MRLGPSLKTVALTSVAIAMLASAAAYGVYRKTLGELGPLPLAAAEQQSVTVVDREDRLLRAFTAADGQWRLPLDPKDVDQHYLKILFAFEDQKEGMKAFLEKRPAKFTGR